VFQLARNSPQFYGSLDSLRNSFATQHYVVLRNLLEEPLLEKIQRNIERAQWHSSKFEEGFSGTEFTLDDPTTLNLILFLLNHPRVLDVIRFITDCEQISEFNGRIYRMAAGAGHGLSWHNDLDTKGARQVGFSMNLSTGVFRGGAFELRDRLTMKLSAQVNNTGFGDVLLFCISKDLEHRVTPIMEGVPKTACAGWFLATGENFMKRLLDQSRKTPNSMSTV
jgi:hypothetical protein